MLDSLCVGTHARVPFVRHDLYFEEWEALGNVLLHGFSSCRYFSVLLSEAFIMHCLFGEAPNDVLIDSFLKYLPLVNQKSLKQPCTVRGTYQQFFILATGLRYQKMQTIFYDAQEINVSI